MCYYCDSPQRFCSVCKKVQKELGYYRFHFNLFERKKLYFNTKYLNQKSIRRQLQFSKPNEWVPFYSYEYYLQLRTKIKYFVLYKIKTKFSEDIQNLIFSYIPDIYVEEKLIEQTTNSKNIKKKMKKQLPKEICRIIKKYLK